jgi:hypothetical protein
MKLFRDLTEPEEAEFRQWARDNYKAFEPIDGTWHTVIQDECVKINAAKELPCVLTDHRGRTDLHDIVKPNLDTPL